MTDISPERYVVTFQHPLFPEVDMLLRRGAHVGEEDQDKHEFVRDAEPVLQAFYRLYQAQLHQSQEGAYYLGVEQSEHFKTLTLSRLDMVIGKTLAAMLLEPDILNTLGRVALNKLLHTIELHPGRAMLLVCAGIRVTDEESGNRKLREAVGKSLNTLADLYFIAWNARAEEIVPFRALLRFADDVRVVGTLDDNLSPHLTNGTAVMGKALDERDDRSNPEDEQ
jgi:chromosome partition protein MukE